MRSVFFILISVFLFTGCKDDKVKTTNPMQNSSRKVEAGTLLADPITYDVVIRNPDPDDAWTTERLEELDLKKLVKIVFQSVEDGKATAYNYHTGERMSITDIKNLEQTDEFDKSKIGKIQFIEDWYFNEDLLIMNKKVKSIMLAYEVYDQFGKIRGYKAGFRVDLN